MSGLIAQGGPAPTVLPYGIHIVLTVACALMLFGTPETRAAGPLELRILCAALVAALQVPPLGVLAAALLGAGYGICLVSGLTEVQRMAPPEDLAGLTAVYYSCTYFGFTFPVLIASLSPLAPEPVLLLLLAAACAACLALVLRGSHTSPRSG